ncbi:LuxR C-terminal-related transcriptional regulator [Nonomuraea sp. NPDC051941]|uniref:helix-turn-helix transcriptional regulator n=1 Tax=Nonomuraea sp. NPDC051941 TaxID=3364373 RepID=UPI0037C6AAB9
MFRSVIAVLLALVALLAWAGPAAAHGRSGEADVRFAQTIGGMEITVGVRASLRVPAPLQVGVVAHTPGRGGRINLAIRSVEGGGSSSGTVRVEAGRPGVYPVMLPVDRVGPPELEGSVLPLAVLVSRTPLWEVVANAAFACVAAALIGVLAPEATTRMIEALQPLLPTDEDRALQAAADRLTERERQVCELIAQGLSDDEIAHRLFISRYTVKVHVSSILTKLDLPDRVHVLISWSRLRGPRLP